MKNDHTLLGIVGWICLVGESMLTNLDRNHQFKFTIIIIAILAISCFVLSIREILIEEKEDELNEQ